MNGCEARKADIDLGKTGPYRSLTSSVDAEAQLHQSGHSCGLLRDGLREGRSAGFFFCLSVSRAEWRVLTHHNMLRGQETETSDLSCGNVQSCSARQCGPSLRRQVARGSVLDRRVLRSKHVTVAPRPFDRGSAYLFPQFIKPLAQRLDNKHHRSAVWLVSAKLAAPGQLDGGWTERNRPDAAR